MNRALLNSLDVKVTGLMEGLTYIFRVCAENLAGPGPFSEPTDRIVTMDAICKFIPKCSSEEQQIAYTDVNTLTQPVLTCNTRVHFVPGFI